MLQVRREGPVLRVALNRPEVRNALDDAVIAELTAIFQQLEPGVRAVVLSGEGKTFCAGGDLGWMQRMASYTFEENYRDALKLAAMFQAMLWCPAAVIAQVHGAAFGGGAGLVACADVAVAAEGTQFSFSEARLGLIPATISGAVVQKIGAGHARALFVTAEPFDAAVALRIGLVHDVAPPEALEDRVQSKLSHILRNGPLAVTGSKRIVLESPLSAEESARRLAEARSGEEGQEGVAAFLEKRKASFVVEP